MVLNSDGWILTAAHLLNHNHEGQRDAPLVSAFQAQVAAIESDKSLKPPAKVRALKRIRGEADARWVTHFSYWWSQNGVSLRDITVIPEADLAVGRLDPWVPDSDTAYPTIKNPSVGMLPGASLCRLGFPFNTPKVEFDPATESFALDQEFTFFPLDGIFTRVRLMPNTKEGFVHKYVETSTPGLRGHSGGPLFDRRGRVWGIQSKTRHIPLGFNPTIDDGRGGKTVEHQFISLGEATHVETIVAVLDSIGVSYELSPD